MMTSSIQDGLWYADLLAPGSPAGNLVRAYRVSGPLDTEALGLAWREVVRRHDVLRTTLAEVGGRPVARVAPSAAAELTTVHLTAVDPEAEFRRWCSDGAATRLTLTDGPLARLTVARFGVHDHGILLLMHRIIADDRSASVIAEELSRAYASVLAGDPPGADLGPHPRQYAEFARRQRETMATPGHAERAARWAADLGGAPPRLDLPTDRVRPGGPSRHGALIRFDWGARVARGVNRLAAVAGVTPRVVTLTAFLTLAHRHTGAARVAVSVPATALPDPGLDRVVGPCAHPVVLCADLSGAPTFREAVDRTEAALRGAEEHRDIPLAEVVRLLDPDRDPRRIPFCDAMVVPRDQPSPLTLIGTRAEKCPADSGATATDLLLSFDPVLDTVSGDLRYRTALFDASTAGRLLDQLRLLLEAALAAPGTSIDCLPLETAADREDALREGDRIGAGRPVVRPAHEQVRLRGLRRPAAPAVRDGETVLTYRDLDRRAAALTAALTQDGPVDDRPVAVRMTAGAGQVAAVLAVLRSGARLVSLDAGQVGERGRSLLAGLRPVALVVDGPAADDDVTHWYRDEQGGRVIDAARIPIAAEPRLRELPGLDDIAYVAHTSGSTGRPKGIPQTHAALAQFSAWFAEAFRIRPGARVAQWAAPSYDASLCEMFGTLTAGATLCVVPAAIRVHPEQMADWIAAEGITLLQTVPSFARELLAAAVRCGGTAKLAGLEHLLLAGEALPGELAADLRAALPDTRLINLYGATETILSTWHEVTAASTGPVPIGRPIPGRQVLVLDDHDEPCPAGVTGQLVVHSPYVTAGYHGADPAEDEVFRPVAHADRLSVHDGRWHRTGDLARRRWDGELEYRGRRDHQIKFNGIRLELAEIEAVLAAQPTIADCVVVAVNGPQDRVSRLVAYVVAAADGAGPDEWRAAVHAHLGTVKVPVLYRVVASLPRNAGGKVDRRRLPDPGLPVTASRELRPPFEPGLAEIWAELLGGEHRDPQATFTAAGGHSLLVPVLLDRIRERFGVEVPIWTYYRDSTLAGLAAAVRDRTAPAPALTAGRVAT